MAKEKVYKIAKEFKVSSEALVQMLRSMGIPVKSHMSTIDESLRDDIKKKFEKERAEVRKKYERKKNMIIKAREDILSKSTKKPEKEEKKEQKKEPEKDKRSFRHKRTHGRAKELFQQGPGAKKTPEQTEKKEPTEKKKRKQSSSKAKKDERASNRELKLNIKKTLAKIGSGSIKKKYKKESQKDNESAEEEKKILNVSEFVTVKELAKMMNQKVSEVIAKYLSFGMFVTINQRLDFETIELLADEFDYAVKLMEEYAPEKQDTENDIPEGKLFPRSPVVTIMGHVDHGKTSLLDYIRKTNVIAGESGGITQHIAAYEVETKHGKVTFLDTPGHEAFTAMRARGSQITDVIVLIVAADSGVKPQTKEAIDHARAANVPIVIAINKIDLPTADINKVKSGLAQNNVLVDGYGGQISCVEISAKTGNNVDKLLETLALETEILELKATPEGNAVGVVVESELDKGKGPIATVLIQHGTLKKGDSFISGIHHGNVRDCFNERGVSVDKVGPSQPAVVLGLSGTPQAGDSFRVVGNDKEAREISGRRRLAQREREIRKYSSVSLDHLYEQIKEGNIQALNIIIKGDVDGSVEALADSLERLSTNEIKINVIHKSVGAIKESDINLATASKAIIIGFHLNPNSKIKEIAKREGVDIRTYRIIYKAVEEIHHAMEGMLAPEIKENITAEIEVREIFKISKTGKIAGCHVNSGKVVRGSKARLIRDDIEIADTTINGLKRFKDDVREVKSGYECGILLKDFSNVQENDRIECYEEVEIARKLSSNE